MCVYIFVHIYEQKVKQQHRPCQNEFMFNKQEILLLKHGVRYTEFSHTLQLECLIRALLNSI